MLKKRINSCDGIYNDFLDVRFTKICVNNSSTCIHSRGKDS